MNVSKAFGLIQKINLRSKLIISYIIIFVLPMLIISNVLYTIFSSHLNKVSMELTQLYTSQIDSTIRNFVQYADNVSRTVFHDKNILYNLKDKNKESLFEKIKTKLTVEKYLSQVTTSIPELAGVVLVGKNEHVYYNSSLHIAEYNAIIKQDWFEKILHSKGELQVFNDGNFFSPHKNYMIFGRLVNDYESNPAGVILFITDPNHIVKMNAKQHSIQEKYDINIIISDIDGNPMIHLNEKGTGNTLSGEKIKGYEDTYIAYDETLDYGLKIKVLYPKKKLYAEIEYIRSANYAVMVFSLIFSISFSLLVSYNITRPLVELQKSIKKVQTGNYETINEVKGNDEIANLIRNYNLMITKINVLFKDVYMAKLKQKQAQFLALQHQVNPHMLYNTLESIRMEAAVSKNIRVADMVKTLAKMFRLTLQPENKINYIRDEVEYAKIYVALQNIRYNDCIHITFEIEPDIEHARIIRLVFQPVIENAIIHGFVNRKKVFNIHLRAAKLKKDILIRITDNGRGIEKHRLEKINKDLEISEIDPDTSKDSIGLKNIYERIRNYYGKNYYLKIYSEYGKGTMVEMLIPKA